MTQKNKIHPLYLLPLIVLFILGTVSNSMAISPKDQVDSLRHELVEEQRGLIDALPYGTKKEPAEYLEKLRSELRTLIRNEIAGPLPSGELEIALHKSARRNILERIDLYEKTYGSPLGQRTTPYNVLTENNLQEMESRLRPIFVELTTSAAAFPDNAVPFSLSGRIDDIRTELDAVQKERVGRVTGVQPKLVDISETIVDPKAFRELQRMEGIDAEKHAERALKVEIEKRNAWNPNDPTLLKVSAEIDRQGRRGGRFAILGLEPGRGWPPDRGPPPNGSTPRSPRGPTSPNSGGTGGSALVVELRSAAQEMVSGSVEGNRLIAADGRARLTVAAKQFSQQLGISPAETPWEIALRAMNDKELKQTDHELQKWKKALIVARERAPAYFHGELALIEAEEQLHLLDKTMRMRGIRGPPPPPPPVTPGPHGQEASLHALSVKGSPPEQIEIKALELEKRRLVELHQALDIAVAEEKLAIREALEIQKIRRIDAEAAAINASWRRAAAIEDAALIYGRGSEGAEAARLALEAKRSLTAQAGALQVISDEYQRIGVQEAKNLAELKVFFTEQPPVAKKNKLRPELIAEISLHLTKAEQVNTKPSIPLPKGNINLSKIKNMPDHFDFGKSFSRDGINSAEAFRSNPRFAPGGVVVDVELPKSITDHLHDIVYKVKEQHFFIKMDDRWRRIEPTIFPATARAAAGFVRDQRVTAVDIGPLTIDDFLWLTENGFTELSVVIDPSIGKKLRQAVTYLNYVRLNPAIADTSVAPDLIAADELIFRMLPLGHILNASETVVQGINVVELFNLRKKEEKKHQDHLDGRIGYKSLLTVEALHVDIRDKKIILSPQVKYHVYAVPEQQEPVLFEAVSDWFAAHDALIRQKNSELDQLRKFSIAVAILRTARSNKLQTVDSEFVMIADDANKTPRFLCRSTLPKICAKPFLQSFTNLSTGEYR